MRSRPPRFPAVLGLGLLAALAAASPAHALDIDDITPLYFPLHGAQTGFVNAGPDFDFATTPLTQQLCAGAGVFQPVASCAGHSGYQITITQNLQTVHQFPQARGTEPTATDPFIADSLWTATNTSDQTWGRVLLLFTGVNLGPYPGAIAQEGYPDLQVGLDGDLLEIVKYTYDKDYFFGAVDLGVLDPGESVQFRVRYIVTSGGMPIVNNQVVMPPLRVVAQVVPVPEPGALMLLLAGLAAIGRFGRQR